MAESELSFQMEEVPTVEYILANFASNLSYDPLLAEKLQRLGGEAVPYAERDEHMRWLYESVRDGQLLTADSVADQILEEQQRATPS